ncbi:MAG TPA: hypothetical protein VMW38_02715 [Terriglobia bacterium]|nr:hypothetical protein [Terriglobia bacterium]
MSFRHRLTGTAPQQTANFLAYYGNPIPWTNNHLDGLERTVKVEKVNSSGTQSIVKTVYDACGCSPLDKVKKSLDPMHPVASSTGPKYTYDQLGRTIRVKATDGQSTSTYFY